MKPSEDSEEPCTCSIGVYYVSLLHEIPNLTFTDIRPASGNSNETLMESKWLTQNIPCTISTACKG